MDEERYSRIRRYRDLAQSLEQWQGSAAAVIGLGGLGCQLVQYLSRLGLPKLVLIDRDVVSWENLGHQLLYTEEDAEKSVAKAEVAHRTVKTISSSTEVVSHFANLTHQNIQLLLEGCGLLFDGLDNYSSRFLVNDYALATSTPYFYAGAVRGEVSAKAVIPGTTSCLRCMLPEPPSAGEIPTCAAEGVFPPLLGIAAALQIELAGRYLSGELDNSPDLLYSAQVHPWRITSIDVGGPKADCPACSLGRFDFLDGGEVAADEACAGGRAERQLTNASLDMAQVAQRLQSSGTFDIKPGGFCVSAANKTSKFTIFKHGYVVAEGVDNPAVLDAFLAEYLGI